MLKWPDELRESRAPARRALDKRRRAHDGVESFTALLTNVLADRHGIFSTKRIYHVHVHRLALALLWLDLRVRARASRDLLLWTPSRAVATAQARRSLPVHPSR